MKSVNVRAFLLLHSNYLGPFPPPSLLKLVVKSNQKWSAGDFFASLHTNPVQFSDHQYSSIMKIWMLKLEWLRTSPGEEHNLSHLGWRRWRKQTARWARPRLSDPWWQRDWREGAADSVLYTHTHPRTTLLVTFSMKTRSCCNCYWVRVGIMFPTSSGRSDEHLSRGLFACWIEREYCLDGTTLQEKLTRKQKCGKGSPSGFTWETSGGVAVERCPGSLRGDGKMTQAGEQPKSSAKNSSQVAQFQFQWHKTQHAANMNKVPRGDELTAPRFDWRMMGSELPKDVGFTSKRVWDSFIANCSYLRGWEGGVDSLRISWRPGFESLQSISVWICRIDLLSLAPTRPERSVTVVAVETSPKCHLNTANSTIFLAARSSKQVWTDNVHTGKSLGCSSWNTV